MGLHIPTASVVLPQDFLLACLTLALACTICIGVRWTFDQLTRAINGYEATVADLLAEERRTEEAAGRAEAQREVHDFLFQDVLTAAMTHERLARRVPSDPSVAAIGAKLDRASALLRETLTSLAASAP